MIVEAQVMIQGSRDEIWTALVDIENAPKILSGIEKIELLEKPSRGLVGLRWRETRILFGKPAAVEKWITDAVDGEQYTTRAEDGGFTFLTTQRITAGPDGVMVTSAHRTQPQSLIARLQLIPMSLFFRGVLKKAIQQDLNDLKAAIERR